MKKFVSIAALALLLAVLAGCTANTPKSESLSQNTKPDVSSQEEVASSEPATSSTAIAESSAAESSSQADAAESSSQVDGSELTESVLRSLMEKNIYCMLNLFTVNSLAPTGEPIKDNIYKANSNKFKNYKEFKDYIESIYSEKTAKMLLEDYPYEGQPKYVDIDGKLCVNADLAGAKGYYVDWSSYSVEFTKSDANSCEFTLTAKIEEPSDNPQKVDYVAKSSAVFENGNWKLTEMIH